MKAVQWLGFQQEKFLIKDSIDKVKGGDRMGGAKLSKRIPQLEGLRIIMCCIIILSHFEFLSNSKIVGGGRTQSTFITQRWQWIISLCCQDLEYV